MKSFQSSTSPCPIGRASRILGDRWVLLILREAFLGASRFEDLMARLPISRAALSSRLTMLLEAKLMERRPPETRRAEYHLTEAGRELGPTLQAMSDWSSVHLFAANEEQKRWDSP